MSARKIESFVNGVIATAAAAADDVVDFLDIHFVAYHSAIRKTSTKYVREKQIVFYGILYLL